MRLIAMNPTLRAELDRVLPILAQRTTPMATGEMLKLLIEQAIIFAIPDRGPEQWDAMLGVYLDALAPLSAEMLDDAFLRWNRSELYPKEPGRHAFFPKPAELFALAEKSRLELHKAAYRAKRAAEHIERQPPPAPSPTERASRRQQLIDMGIIDADGNALLGAPKAMPGAPPRAGRTPQEVAAQLRAQADKPPNPDEAI